jgi:hypothetical protein
MRAARRDALGAAALIKRWFFQPPWLEAGKVLRPSSLITAEAGPFWCDWTFDNWRWFKALRICRRGCFLFW